MFVSLWAQAARRGHRPGDERVVATWPTAEHPTEMVLSPDGKALYVACANSTKVSVLDPATGKALQTIALRALPDGPERATRPTACA